MLLNSRVTEQLMTAEQGHGYLELIKEIIFFPSQISWFISGTIYF
jgi:hypothetical protein